MTNPISAFPLGTIEGVSKIVGDLYSGTELARIIAEVPLRSDPGEGHNKWCRLAHAVSSNQAKIGNGNALIALVRAAMRPERTLDRKSRADIARDELNQVLSLVSLKVRLRPLAWCIGSGGRVARNVRRSPCDPSRKL